LSAVNWVSKHHCTKRQKAISLVLLARGQQRCGSRLAQRRWPGPPGLAGVRAAQRHEERVVVQPVRLALAPGRRRPVDRSAVAAP
jgi:hypothetical protein